MKKLKIPLVVIILTVILIIGGLVFVFGGIKLNKKPDNVSQENLKNSKDSDNDGLKDWEEELYKTNPYNPDTDNDDVSDYEEIRLGRNPLVKAPGDETIFHPLPLGEKYNITKKVLNEETIGKLLSSYLSQRAEYLKNHPEITDPSQFSALADPLAIEKIAERSIYDSYNYLMGPNEENLSELSEIFNISISDDQIKISQDNSKESIEVYISKISEWLNSDIFFLQNQALQILSNTFKNQDFNNLDRLIKLNDSWIDEMKEITVPSSWKEIHKQGLQIIILSRNIFVSLRDYENDWIKAYYAAEKLEEITPIWTELIKQAINLAETQGIQLPL